jgi:hypothetical protein
MDTIIRGGTIVTAEASYQADVGQPGRGQFLRRA